MWVAGVLFGVIFVAISSQCVVEGRLDYIKTKSGWTNPSASKDQLLFRSPRRTDLGRYKRSDNVPVASLPFILDGDSHRYARVHYSGEDSDVVFVVTYDLDRDSNTVVSSSFYRSSDYGKTFTDESNKFPPGFKLHPYYHISPDKNIIIIPDDVKETIYISTDEGVTYTARNVPVEQRSLTIHPTQNGWMLGIDFSYNLRFSNDLGQSWQTVAPNIRGPGDYSWGVPGVDWGLDDPDVGVLFYNTYDQGTGQENTEVSLFVSHYRAGKFENSEFDRSLGKHDAFLIVDRFIFVQHTINRGSGEVELFVSFDRKPFNLARIPFEDGHQHYYVGSYRSAQAIVVIEHNSGVNNVYLSDDTATYYTLSLGDVVLVQDQDQGSFDLDFELIDSMNGTFIANQYVPGTSHRQVRTLITFDNGVEWKLMEAPEVDINQNAIDCELPSCSLHFHMSSSEYSRLGVYSVSSAPGIIIAHGNYGRTLAENADLYISRDGGLRWEQTLNGSWDAEIIDHGGLLIAAKDYHQEDDTTIKYSCNEGISWNDFTFTTTPTVIWGIITEPGETTTEVTLFGSENRTVATDTELEWAIVSINFFNVFQRNCSNSDYQDWAVSDGRIEGQACLLGEARVIERRKIDICCLSGEKYERTVSATPCNCTKEDFECDWGYKSDDYDGGRCVVDHDFDSERRTDQKCTSGYRKIAGDTCVGGVTDDFLSCSPKSGSTSESHDEAVMAILGILFALSVIVIIALLIVVVVLFRRLKQGDGYHIASGTGPLSTSPDNDDDDVALLRP
ncbi:VPS10 domain-containing receptor SorCS1-like [Dysidea avara]|uniref:VPS10 domain-containing receptor SorCS1-like n=1 Tax=Dysidea avara TaxID=196820 RepID=UPI00332C71AD